MLFELLYRIRISLAVHLFVEPQGDRPRSMMVTSRWLESLLSGCIVAGRRPISRMADDMLFWQNSTIELSEEPQVAVDELIALLSRNDTLEQQRHTNISHIFRHHDWRYRIESFCKMMALPILVALPDDLLRLHELADSFDHSL